MESLVDYTSEINEAFKDVDNFATMLYNIVKTFFNRKEVKT